jgi:hypothetical protein
MKDRKHALTVAFPHKAACIISLSQPNPKDPRQIRIGIPNATAWTY